MQFVSFLGRFRADNPGIDITLLESMPDRLASSRQGRAGRGADGPPGRLSGASPGLTKLYSEPFVIACSAGHRFAMQDEMRMAELDGEFYFSRINCEYLMFSTICA